MPDFTNSDLSRLMNTLTDNQSSTGPVGKAFSDVPWSDSSANSGDFYFDASSATPYLYFKAGTRWAVIKDVSLVDQLP